jgi:hypothetical protein
MLNQITRLELIIYRYAKGEAALTGAENAN